MTRAFVIGIMLWVGMLAAHAQSLEETFAFLHRGGKLTEGTRTQSNSITMPREYQHRPETTYTTVSKCVVEANQYK
jgi:hypothetical protein